MKIDEEGFLRNMGILIKLQSSGSALPHRLLKFRAVQDVLYICKVQISINQCICTRQIEASLSQYGQKRGNLSIYCRTHWADRGGVQPVLIPFPKCDDKLGKASDQH